MVGTLISGSLGSYGCPLCHHPRTPDISINRHREHRLPAGRLIPVLLKFVRSFRVMCRVDIQNGFPFLRDGYFDEFLCQFTGFGVPAVRMDRWRYRPEPGPPAGPDGSLRIGARTESAKECPARQH